MRGSQKTAPLKSSYVANTGGLERGRPLSATCGPLVNVKTVVGGGTLVEK